VEQDQETFARFRHQEHLDQRLDSLDDFLRLEQDKTARGEAHMTRQEYGNKNTVMYAEGAELVLDRIFQAPRKLVWEAITSPVYIPQWWGPADTTATVELMDVQQGGKWRWVAVMSADDPGTPFQGTYQEVVVPERLVRTLEFDSGPMLGVPPFVETTTLDEVEGGTQVYNITRFPSEEILQGALATGVTKAALDSYDRLAELLTRMG
jgi:uncharacterized protein YndB with AHSA1/START domain